MYKHASLLEKRLKEQGVVLGRNKNDERRTTEGDGHRRSMGGSENVVGCFGGLGTPKRRLAFLDPLRRCNSFHARTR